MSLDVSFHTFHLDKLIYNHSKGLLYIIHMVCCVPGGGLRVVLGWRHVLLWVPLLSLSHRPGVGLHLGALLLWAVAVKKVVLHYYMWHKVLDQQIANRCLNQSNADGYIYFCLALIISKPNSFLIAVMWKKKNRWLFAARASVNVVESDHLKKRQRLDRKWFNAEFWDACE